MKPKKLLVKNQTFHGNGFKTRKLNDTCGSSVKRAKDKENVNLKVG